MMLNTFRNSILTATVLLMTAISSWSSAISDEKHVEVSMRMIGHELLLNSGDSLSRIMPIQKNTDGKYHIEFENDFSFKPVELNGIVSAIMSEKKIAGHFLVEVIDCHTFEVVYSYEEGMTDTSTVIPCGVREQPVGCYSLFITLLDIENPSNTIAGAEPNEEKGDARLAILILVSLGIVIGIVAYIRNRNSGPDLDSHIIQIGRYQFDQRNMALSLDEERVELTSKEADLLSLLYGSANETLEHDQILKAVWGSNGDYVGRTLDVFISKLRKKLGADTTIKIVNIRGVGYKLVLNG